MRHRELQSISGRNGWLDGVRKLWEPDTIPLDGTESKANPSIYNPKIAGTERTCRVKYVWRGGYIIATQTNFMALEPLLLPQLPPLNKWLRRQRWHNADDLRQLQIRYNLQRNGTQTWPYRHLCATWSIRRLTIEWSWHTDGMVKMKQAM